MFSIQQLIKAFSKLQKVSSLSTFDTICELLKQTPKTAVMSLMSEQQNNTMKLPATNRNVAKHIVPRPAVIVDDSNSLLSDLQVNGTSCNLRNFHTSDNQCLHTKQKHTQFAMYSLVAEPLSAVSNDGALNKDSVVTNGCCTDAEKPQSSENNGTPAAASAKPCFNTGLADILKFMELIGNLKHTKRTGWVLRDVNDCESISGHMYRMSMMTFLLDGSEGLNQIRCMELALVHDLAESLVGDITPFCGVSKGDKRAMEFKAMDDICKLIEPRGKRIMELFEEYENGESAESKFVKDLDRLDMVMQAFEYEKRDDCLLKHQEFFDSTRGKFKHPFVQKLVEEIYVQRDELARAKGATPPPPVHVPDMGDNGAEETKLDGEKNPSS